jgi:hypothetical protein
MLALPLVEEVVVSHQPAKQEKAATTPVGSISGKNICQEELDLMPTWERFFKTARKNNPPHGDRWTVTDTDFAQAVVLLRFFTENRNPDGSLPQRRVQANGLAGLAGPPLSERHRAWRWPSVQMAAAR